jgi:hypothetical protein
LKNVKRWRAGCPEPNIQTVDTGERRDVGGLKSIDRRWSKKEIIYVDYS